MDDLFKELEFVKLKVPRIIPIELIENVKGRTFTPEEFYEHQVKHVGNPYNMLYALIDKNKKIQGFLWAVIDWDKTLFINTFSVSKEYWGKGKAIEKVKEFLKELKTKMKTERVMWISTNEKFFIKHGFKRSKNVILEYNSPI